MTELKTKENDSSVIKFLNTIDDEKRRKEAFELLEIFEKATKEKPKMWGKNIVGFGKYHYKYKSGQEGDWMLTGFSPRKLAFSIYIMSGFNNYEDSLKELGKHTKSSGSCLYIKRLEDINIKIIKKMITDSSNEVLRNNRN